MIKSMTGFGRCEIQETERKITVEMKSVNHRYLDVSMKMPKKLNFFEASVRSELKIISRGERLTSSLPMRTTHNLMCVLSIIRSLRQNM